MPSIQKELPEAQSTAGRGALLAGALAAILASACCLGPLILLTLGVSGAWIGNLTALEPYRPIFIGTALVALFFCTGASTGPLALANQVRSAPFPSFERPTRFSSGWSSPSSPSPSCTRYSPHSSTRDTPQCRDYSRSSLSCSCSPLQRGLR